MDEMTWEKLTEVYGRLEADVLKSYLEAGGISVELFQEAVGHHIYPSTIDGLGRVQIYIPKAQAAQARELLAAWQNQTSTNEEEHMQDTIIQITNYGMGKGDQALQLKLAAKYLELIQSNPSLPNAICFYTDGVKLVVDGSPILEQLRALEAKGVRLIVCSTCLEHYGLTDKVQVGIVGAMTDIIEAQVKASKVITL